MAAWQRAGTPLSLGGLPPDEEVGEPRDGSRPTDCGPAKGSCCALFRAGLDMARVWNRPLGLPFTNGDFVGMCLGRLYRYTFVSRYVERSALAPEMARFSWWQSEGGMGSQTKMSRSLEERGF